MSMSIIDAVHRGYLTESDGTGGKRLPGSRSIGWESLSGGGDEVPSYRNTEVRVDVEGDKGGKTGVTPELLGKARNKGKIVGSCCSYCVRVP